jgi:hypothetical protein
LRKFWNFEVLWDGARQRLLGCVGGCGLVVVLNQVFSLPQSPAEIF